MNYNILIFLVLIYKGAAENFRDCDNKDFLCFDKTHFYYCVKLGNSTTVIGDPQQCPPGLVCSDLNDLACDEPEEVPTPSSSTTSKLISSTTILLAISKNHSSTIEEIDNDTTSTFSPITTIPTTVTPTKTSSTETSKYTTTTFQESTTDDDDNDTTGTTKKYGTSYTSTDVSINTNTTPTWTSTKEGTTTDDCDDNSNYSTSITEKTTATTQQTFSSITPIPEHTNKRKIFHCSTNNEKFSDPISCTAFYVCVPYFFEYRAILTFCPRGRKYDSVNKRCTIGPVQCPGDPDDDNDHEHNSDDYDHQRDRDSYKEKEFACHEEGKFPVLDNCRNYYKCQKRNGEFQLKLKICRHGQLFDWNLKRCRRNQLVRCSLESSEEQ